MQRKICHIISAVLLSMAALVAGPVPAAGQNVSISMNGVSVRTAVDYLRQTYRLSFIINSGDVDMDKLISVNKENASLDSVLGDIFKGQDDLEFRISGKTVSVIRSAVPDQPKDAPAGDRTNLISGEVIDENGDALAGALVAVCATGETLLADSDGKFEFTASSDTVKCRFSFFGCNDVGKVLVCGRTNSVVMTSKLLALDDVVVVGYGVQNRRDVTTSIASMNASDFAVSDVADFREAMAAKMPGVQVINLGGQPEGNVSVRVRGIQSATSGNDPLYVIDGVVSDSRAFTNLDSGEIESLEVLKDASASAIYGSRGSCGVIIITTRRGSSEPGKAEVSYNGQFTVSEVSKRYDLMNSYEFAQMYREARDGAYLYNVPTGTISDPYASRPQTYHMVPDCLLPYLNGESGLTDTDWQSQVFRTALSHKHNLSVSGKGSSCSYFVSGNYLKRQGIIIGSDFERFGLRANLDGNRGRLKYGFSLSPSYSVTNHVSSDSQYKDDGVIAAMLMCPPIYPVYNEDGSYNWDMNGTPLRSATVEGQTGKDTQSNAVLNPVALALEIKDVRKSFSVMGNVYAAYEFIKGLEYRITLGGDAYVYERNYYRPSSLPMADNWKYNYQASTPTAINTKTNDFTGTITNQLSFNRTFGDHKVNAVAVYEAQKRITSNTAITGTGTAGDDKITTTFGKTIAPGDAYNDLQGYSFASWLFRGQYSYKSRYMLSASIRGDASSRFAPDNRWGYFPAASLGWRMSGEPWMESCGQWMDDLKIRASVGQTGNAQIGNYEYLALYSAGTKNLGSGLQNMTYSSQIANSNLGWEKNTQYNVGVDMSLWRGMLGLNADFYYTRTTDMLFDVPVPAATGFTTATTNIGSMENKGVELTLSSAKRFSSGFNYNVSANWSLNRNKVLSLGGGNQPIITEGSYSGAHFITKVGEPIGCYYLMVADGIFHDREELACYPHEATTQVGDYRFVDVNGDGRIDQETDRAIVGNYMPDFYYGINISFGYKGFDLSASFQGVYGNEILNIERRYIVNNEGTSNGSMAQLGRFPSGNNVRATRKSTGYSQSWISTASLEDGSYFRLQNLTLGYTMPDKWFGKTGIHGFRIYLQGGNLFTLTNYTGFNPEVNKNSSNPLKPGEDYCSYPLQRSLTLGLKISL